MSRELERGLFGSWRREVVWELEWGLFGSWKREVVWDFDLFSKIN